MINNPLFRKLKENSLWWLLVAVLVLMLGIVTVDTGIGIDSTRTLLAEEAHGDIHVIQHEGENYLFILYRDSKKSKIGYRLGDTELTKESLKKYLAGKGISLKNLTFPAPPKKIPSSAEQILNAQLSVVRITTGDETGRGIGSGFSIGEYEDYQGDKEAIVTNHHVIKDDKDRRVKVEIFDKDGNVIKVVEGVVGPSDPETDLAIISIPVQKRLPSILISLTPPKPGDEVVQIGCSKGGNPVLFPVSPPFRKCVIVKSNFIELSGEIIFIDPEKNIGVAGGRSGGPIIGIDPKTGRLSVVGVCNARDETTKPVSNLGCSSTSLTNFLNKIGWGALLKIQERERRVLIKPQR